MTPQPVIAVVVDEPELRVELASDLRQRYGSEYAVLELGSEDVHPALSEVPNLAVVISTVELDGEVTGVELLAGVRRTHRDARRVLLVRRGQWASHPVRRAMVLGEVDGYLFVPWLPREQWLHLPMAEYLADWSRTQKPEITAVTIVGRPWESRSHSLRDILSRASVPFAFHDADSQEGRAALEGMGTNGSTLPVVKFHTGEVAVDPSDITISEMLGFRTSRPGLACDVAIVGAGPAGLSAAVYAASEGLSTMIIDPSVPGGQAGTSSRIRNYLGFPRGLSGSDLTNRATEQAWLFGAEFLLARHVERLQRSEDGYVMALSDGTDVSARAVVLATGVEWRRLATPSVEAFLGAGVFYGAAGTEADALQGEPVFVIGGGNSAGQAAVHLARHAKSVTILIRGESLAASMSDYLIMELEAIENVTIRATTEVITASGVTRLQQLSLRQRLTGAEDQVDAVALFVMIGGRAPHPRVAARGGPARCAGLPSDGRRRVWL